MDIFKRDSNLRLKIREEIDAGRFSFHKNTRRYVFRVKMSLFKHIIAEVTNLVEQRVQ